jgi:hypothetical protein
MTENPAFIPSQEEKEASKHIKKVEHPIGPITSDGIW